MENKEFPELEVSETLSDDIPVLTEHAGDMPPLENMHTDYFADILPEISETSTADTGVTADTVLLSEIQAAVESVIAEEIPLQEEISLEELPESCEGPSAESIPDPEEINAAEETEESTFQQALQQEAASEEIADGDFPDELEGSQETEDPMTAFERSLRKGRPKRRKGEFLFGIPQIAVTCVWLAIILVTGLTLGRMLWVCAADILAFGREDKMVTVTVYESDSMEDIIEKLHKADLIRYPGLFKLYADLAVEEGEIKPGIWDLNTMYDYHALVNMMSPSSSRTVVEDVLIPEGFTCRQIFSLLEENRICTAKDLAEYAANGELKEYWFLENVERGYEYCLEGFLFPDTYDFYKNSNPRDVLEKLLDNFEFRFTEEMKAQLDTLNQNVTQGTFDIHKAVIVASMIEKETAANEESPKVASVIYNRLFNWGGNPAFLNIDASIVYALDGKTDLTAEDLKVESPYNTYTNTGLTPGAIANPGLASLKAALNPESTNFYFYVLNPAEGRHKFSTTLDEHNTFIASLE